MAQDTNLYGAPTSGLGGTVTFTAPTPDAPQIGTDAGTASRTYQGATIEARQVQAHPVDLDTAGLVSTFANRVIGPKLQEEQASRFVAGMQQAMAGHTIQEIADAQPWYSKLFGGADAVAGARAYTADQKVMEAVNTAEQKMPELRTQSPADVHQILTDGVKSHLTGDPEADSHIMSAYARHLPGLLKVHTREHYAWQQGEALRSNQAAMSQAATRLTQIATRGVNPATMTEDSKAEYDAGIAAALTAFAPPPIDDIAAWQKATAGMLAGRARQGDFRTINILRDRGYFDQHFAGQEALVAQIDRAEAAGRAHVKAQHGGAFSARLADWRYLSAGHASTAARRAAAGMEPVNNKQLADTAAQINHDWMELTGDRHPLISDDQLAAAQSGFALAQDDQWLAGQKEIERVRKEADATHTKVTPLTADERDDRLATLAMGRVDVQGTFTAMKQHGLTDRHLGVKVRQVFDGLNKPEDKATLLTVMHERQQYVDSGIKHYLSEGVQGALNAGTEAVFAPVFKLFSTFMDRGQIGTQGAYYSDQDAARLRRAYNEHKRLTDTSDGTLAPAMIQTLAYRAFLADVPKGGAKERAGLSTWATDAVQGLDATTPPRGFLRRTASSEPVTPQLSNLVTDLLGEGDVPADLAGAQHKLAAMKAEGRLELSGGYGWTQAPGQRPFFSAGYYPPATDMTAMGKILSGTIEQRNAALGIEKVQQVLRLPDEGGVGQLLFVGATKDGSTRVMLLSTNDMRAGYAAYTADLNAKAKAAIELAKPGPRDMLNRPLKPGQLGHRGVSLNGN